MKLQRSTDVIKTDVEKKNHLEQGDFIKDFLKTVKIDNASSVIYF